MVGFVVGLLGGLLEFEVGCGVNLYACCAVVCGWRRGWTCGFLSGVIVGTAGRFWCG